MSFASSAVAANKDAATLKKIDEALTVHYMAAEYDKAEQVLSDAIKACGTKFCSAEVLAKAHVAVGVVRGNAKQDLAGARAAFEVAKVADPYVTLDAALVTPKVLAEFYKVMGREPPPEAKQSEESTAEPPPPEIKEAPRVSPAGDLRCTPVSGYEIQTAQPIAVVCEPLEGVVRAELYYRVEGQPEYTAILMSIQDGTLRANIPCEPLVKPGKLEVYIIAQDFNKEMIDTFGNMLTPAYYAIVEKTKQPVPTYPGKLAPKRCNEILGGVASVGESCDATKLCMHGLYCAEGTCRKAPACETAADCESNSCTNGFCDIGQQAAAATGELNHWMIGLHGGLDIWLAPSAKQVCGDASVLSGDYNCYNSGETKIYQTPPRNSTIPITNPGDGGNVAAGVRLATIRLLLSGDYILARHLSVGGRLGWAFNGGPKTIHYYEDGTIRQKKPFFPAHIEARGTLWFRSLAKSGLHPYLSLGGGIAEVDAKIPIKGTLGNTSRNLDAWRKMGVTFAAAGLGVHWGFGKHHGAQLNINAMYMMPSAGIVIEPSLGYVFGF
jgi:hypothetical protein